jgi:hypothetical protein
MKKLVIIMIALMLVLIPVSAKAHGEEETGSKWDGLFGGEDTVEENSTDVVEESTEDVSQDEEVEDINSTEVEDVEVTSEGNVSEVEDILEETEVIKSSVPVANENSSAKKLLFIYVLKDIDTDANTLIQNVEGIQLKSYTDEGITAIVPESQFDTLTTLGFTFLTKEDYNRLIAKEKTIIDYGTRDMNRKQQELSYSELQAAEELAAKELEEAGEIYSNPYTYYFMDTADLPDVSNPSAAYKEASAIVYVSDDELWQTSEKWVSPNNVYAITPSLSSNPTNDDEPVSDCEEHAMTFVQLCRQAGVKATDVRVVTGYVEINNEKYGHAWAQLKVDGEWVNIEPTSGSYYEDGKIYRVDPMDMYFYQDLTYPAVEIWSYFNDEYYVSANGRDAPDDWIISDTAYSAGTTDTSFAGFIQYCISYIEKELYKVL